MRYPVHCSVIHPSYTVTHRLHSQKWLMQRKRNRQDDNIYDARVFYYMIMCACLPCVVAGMGLGSRNGMNISMTLGNRQITTRQLQQKCSLGRIMLKCRLYGCPKEKRK